MPPLQKVNLTDAFGRFHDLWSPKIAGAVNDCHIKLAKLQGEFVWHHHDEEDELFLVVKGSMLMQLRDGDIRLDEGDFLIVPRGIEHRPVAEEETWILLVEPAGTLNTGNVYDERTVAEPERL